MRARSELQCDGVASNMQLTLLLEMGADSLPDRVAVTDTGGALSLGEVAARARTAATVLRDGQGDKVVFLGQNGASLPVALFSSSLVGKPFVPLNYRLTDEDLRKLLVRAAPCTAIVDDDMLERAAGVAGVDVIARSDFDKACTGGTDEPVEPLSESDIAILLFTSGTTGEPKVAVLRHHHLTSYVVSTVEFMSADESEAAMVAVPPYHIAGISAILTGLYSGRRIVYLPAFTPEAWVETAANQKISHAMVVPTMLDRILDLMERNGHALPHLKAISYGGGRMPQPVIERAIRLLPHVDFVNAYGLTETSSTIAVLGPEDHRLASGSSDPNVRRRLGSVGRPLPTLELEVRDPEGNVLPPNESGEIYVRGDQVAGEYLHKKAIQEDGWFATNDAGWIDDDGYLFVEGRLDDVIVRGGENISPGEIEDVLRQHPKVRDLAVFGVEDNQWGEKVACVVVPVDSAPDIAELTAWVKTRLRSTKTPEAWAFWDELPYNDMGKLLRRVVKQQFISAVAVAG